MADKFNSYRQYNVIDFWHDICLEEGILRHYERGDYFFREGEFAPYLGYISKGTLKYVAFDDNGEEHVMGLEFTNGFVADFPFSLQAKKARLSVIATSPSDIYCISIARMRELMDSNTDIHKIMEESLSAVFEMVYLRYKDLYTKTPQQRYKQLITSYPDLFSLFSLRDIASFLKITPTHLSRLRKNI